MQKADSRPRAAVFSTIFQSRFYLLGPAAALLQQLLAGENGGLPRCCPVLCGLRDRCIAAMLATRARHEGGVEPPQPGL